MYSLLLLEMNKMSQIGITERGDAALDTSWKEWVGAGKPAILISKDPMKLFHHISSFLIKPNVIIHCTITGYGGSLMEPGVPKLEDACEGYKKLKDLLGHDRVILRIDPVIPTEKGMKRIQEVIRHTEHIDPRGRVRISFMDNYPHVKERFKKVFGKSLPYEFHADLETRVNCLSEICYQMLEATVEICGEPGMECKGCVSAEDLSIFGINADSPDKLKGQRPLCKCLSLKKELLNKKGQCQHGCIYCYWK